MVGGPATGKSDTAEAVLRTRGRPPSVGVLGAVALPVVGVGVGVAQIVRGVANTPEAIREQQKGKSWDQVCVHLADCMFPAVALSDMC